MVSGRDVSPQSHNERDTISAAEAKVTGLAEAHRDRDMSSTFSKGDSKKKTSEIPSAISSNQGIVSIYVWSFFFGCGVVVVVVWGTAPLGGEHLPLTQYPPPRFLSAVGAMYMAVSNLVRSICAGGDGGECVCVGDHSTRDSKRRPDFCRS